MGPGRARRRWGKWERRNEEGRRVGLDGRREDGSVCGCGRFICHGRLACLPSLPPSFPPSFRPLSLSLLLRIPFIIRIRPPGHRGRVVGRCSVASSAAPSLPSSFLRVPRTLALRSLSLSLSVCSLGTTCQSPLSLLLLLLLEVESSVVRLSE